MLLTILLHLVVCHVTYLLALLHPVTYHATTYTLLCALLLAVLQPVTDKVQAGGGVTGSAGGVNQLSTDDEVVERHP